MKGIRVNSEGFSGECTLGYEVYSEDTVCRYKETEGFTGKKKRDYTSGLHPLIAIHSETNTITSTQHGLP